MNAKPLNELWQKLQKISPTRTDQILLGVLCVGLVIGLFTQLRPGGPPAHAESAAEMESAPDTDTLIPEGFVLVPIRLENQQALLALMGPYAVLNIYEA